MILGIGNLLFSDEGFGVRVLSHLLENYRFPENVSLEDGGVLGVNLLGIISRADHLIVIDAVRNEGQPGDIHRLDDHDLPGRIRLKNSLHQVDFLEALTLCQALERVPKTVIETLSTALTPAVQAQVEPVAKLVLEELARLGVVCAKGECRVSCDPLKGCHD
jgi:hydrogenase maturation protease